MSAYGYPVPRQLRRPVRLRSRRAPHRRIVMAAAITAIAAAALAGTPVVAARHHAPPPHCGYTPQSWAVALLGQLGDPRTPCDLAGMTAWEDREGGNWANDARYNPLNTTMPEPGSHSINSVHVQAYTSWRQGLTATNATLHNGAYPSILAALAAGDDAQQVADAVVASPWGTRPFEVSC